MIFCVFPYLYVCQGTSMPGSFDCPLPLPTAGPSEFPPPEMHFLTSSSNLCSPLELTSYLTSKGEPSS